MSNLNYLFFVKCGYIVSFDIFISKDEILFNKRETEDAAKANNYLLGQELAPPFETYPITSITVEKVKKISGIHRCTFP